MELKGDNNIVQRIRASNTVSALSSGVKWVGEGFASRELYTAILIVLIGIASFGLGRLSKIQESRLPIQIKTVPEAQSASVVSAVFPPERGNMVVSGGGSLVGSKGGTKYHFPWCSGAKRISEANKIWFSSVEEARKAGYTPAGNCKGLQ